MKPKHSIISLKNATQTMRDSLELIKPPGMKLISNFIMSRSDQLPTLRPDVIPLGWGPLSWSEDLDVSGGQVEFVGSVYAIPNSEARIYITNIKPMGGDASDATVVCSTWSEGTVTGDEESNILVNSSASTALWMTKVWPGCWIQIGGGDRYYEIASIQSDGKLTLATGLNDSYEDDTYTIYRTHHRRAGNWPARFEQFGGYLLYASRTPTEFVESQICGPFAALVSDVEDEQTWIRKLSDLILLTDQEITALATNDYAHPYKREYSWWADDNCQVGRSVLGGGSGSATRLISSSSYNSDAPWLYGKIIDLVIADGEVYAIEESGRVHSIAEDDSDSSWTAGATQVHASAPGNTIVTKARAQADGSNPTSMIEAVTVTNTGWVQVLINTVWAGSNTGAGLKLHDAIISDDYVVAIGVSDGTNCTVRRTARSVAISWNDDKFANTAHLKAGVWLRESDTYVAGDSDGHIWTSAGSGWPGSISWSDGGDMFSGASVEEMETDYFGRVIVATTDDRKIWYSGDAGSTWTEIVYTARFYYDSDDIEDILQLKYDEFWGLLRLIRIYGINHDVPDDGGTRFGQRRYYEHPIVFYPDYGTETDTDLAGNTAGGNTIPTDVLYNGSITLIATLDGIYTNQGGTWSQDHAPAGAEQGVLALAMEDSSAAGSRYVVGVGEQSTIYYTQEGGTINTYTNPWTTHANHSGTSGTVLYDVAWRTSDNYWVAVGSGGTVLTKSGANPAGAWTSGWGVPGGLTEDILTISDNGKFIGTESGVIYKWSGSAWAEYHTDSNAVAVLGCEAAQRGGGIIAVPSNGRIVFYEDVVDVQDAGAASTRPDCSLGTSWAHALESGDQGIMVAISDIDFDTTYLEVTIDGGNTWYTQQYLGSSGINASTNRTASAYVNDGTADVRSLAGIAISTFGASDGSFTLYYHHEDTGSIHSVAFPAPDFKAKPFTDDHSIGNPIHDAPEAKCLSQNDDYIVMGSNNGMIASILEEYIFDSPSGYIWVDGDRENVGRGNTINGVNYIEDGDDTYWLAAGDYGLIAISKQPNWGAWDTSESIASTNTIYGVIRDEYTLTGASESLLLLGTDGTHAKIWRATVSSGSWTISAYASHDAQVGAFRDGVIWSSSDGVLVGDNKEGQFWSGAAFEECDMPSGSTDLVGVDRHSSTVVAVGSDTILVSTDDGESFDEASNPVNANWTDVKYNSGGDVWVAVSGTDEISAASEDGDTWERLSSDGVLCEQIIGESTIYGVSDSDDALRLCYATEIPTSSHLGFDAEFLPVSDYYRANCVAICGGQAHYGGTLEWDEDSEEWELHARRVRRSCLGTYDIFENDALSDPPYTGAGFIDLPGTGEIWDLIAIGNNMTVIESQRIGLITQTGNSLIPYAYRPIAEGIWPVSNVVLVNQNVYFVASDGLIYVIERGTSVRRLSTGFDLTRGGDYTYDSDEPIKLTYSPQLQALMVHQNDSSTVYLVEDETGVCSQLDFPTVLIDADGEEEENYDYEDYDIVAAFSASSPGNADVLISYVPTSVSSNPQLTTGKLGFGDEPTGEDDPWTETGLITGGGGGD